MTKADILALSPRAQTRLLYATDTEEFIAIPENKSGADAYVLPTGISATIENALVAVMDATLTRTAAMGAPEDEAEASNVFTLQNNQVADKAVNIGDITYVFKVTPTLPYQVEVGADIEESLLNLAAAINDGDLFGGEAHPDVTATSDATTLTVTAKVVGTAANQIATTVENTLDGAWGTETLTGGYAASVGTKIGQLLRAGDASPYDWYRWDGAACDAI